MQIICPDCGTRAALTAENWRCVCGGAWEPVSDVRFLEERISHSARGLWKYLFMYGVAFERPLVTLGAGGTPLVDVHIYERSVLCKLEYFAPTASFKDRGVEMMVNLLKWEGVKEFAEDSSGNAGASVAAYAAAAGMKAHIYIPESTSMAKQNQIAVYGATIHRIAGARVNAKIAVQKAAEEGMPLGSHAYHPGFLMGLESIAWEIWEQMGRKVPDWYVVPVGQGGNLLGAWLGFRRLLEDGMIEKMPRFVAVQPAMLDPLCRAWRDGLRQVRAMEPPEIASVAEGLAITQPVRGTRLLQALYETNGRCISVTEDEIWQAYHTMAGKGFFIEPTSATAVAGLGKVLDQMEPDESIVTVLTGSGLKTTPKLTHF